MIINLIVTYVFHISCVSDRKSCYIYLVLKFHTFAHVIFCKFGLSTYLYKLRTLILPPPYCFHIQNFPSRNQMIINIFCNFFSVFSWQSLKSISKINFILPPPLRGLLSSPEPYIQKKQLYFTFKSTNRIFFCC